MAGTTKREESRIVDKLEALWHLWLKWRERATITCIFHNR
jgi:hypothetical protein